jgi:L-asparaginase
VVVTTGTDTLEEVAYLLHLLWRRDEPVVVTGAMRTADAPGSDGPANVLAAVTVAASPTARGHGCLVTLNNQVHSAAAVRKSHTTSPAAFRSVGAVPVGEVHEGTARLAAPAPRPTPLPLPAALGDVPRVALLRVTLDDDAELFRHAASHYDGVVVEVFGAGHVPSWWVEPLREAARRIPVAVVSRTGEGRLLRGSYGFPGSERDLVSADTLLIDGFDGIKARILLTLALLSSSDRTEVTRAVLANCPGRTHTEVTS